MLESDATLTWSGEVPLYARKVLFFGTGALALLILMLVMLGGLVRRAGAGLACPDWPLCYGQMFPSMDLRIFLEWFHRLVAGAVSMFLIVFSAAVYFQSQLRRVFRRLFFVADSLLFAQIVLGGMTVLGLLKPRWVTSHLAVGEALWATILIAALKFRDFADGRGIRSQAAGGLEKLTIVTALMAFGQIILGGLVSSNLAGMACPDFPTCNGRWVPDFMSLPITLQFLHRSGALVTAILVIMQTVAILKRREVSEKTRLVAMIVPLIVAVQILIGAGAVLAGLPLLLSVIHLGLATLLFGSTVLVAYEARHD